MSWSERGSGRVFVAGLLIVLGLAFLLKNLQVFDVFQFLGRLWPVVLIVIGLRDLRVEKGPGRGLLLTVTGVVLLLFTFDVLEWSHMGRWWPLLLIGMGVFWLLQSRAQRAAADLGVEEDTLRATALFGSTEHLVRSTRFRHAELTATLGALEIDLREAQLDPAGARIEATVLLGNIEIRLPPDWNVILHGTPILGSCQDSRRPLPPAEPQEPKPQVAIRASVLFGSVEVKD